MLYHAADCSNSGGFSCHSFGNMAWRSFLWISISAAEDFTLPANFEGTWQGIPEVSVIGPWSQNFTFSISKDAEDYVFEANLPFDASPTFHQFPGLAFW